LSIVSAPTTATNGATAEVTVGWTGAASGRSLGAVSHADESGLLSLTVVTVDA
jgi:hypothetical protein